MRRCTVRFLILLFLLTVPVPGLFGQAAISLSQGSAVPGGSATLNLSIGVPGPVSPAAVQWTIGYSVVDVASVTVAASTAATAAGKSVNCTPGAGSLTCVAYGLNTTQISSGVLASVTVGISPTSPNSFTTIALSGALSASAQAAPVATTATGNTIAISQPTAGVTITTSPAGLGIVVDGASYTAPQTFQWTPGSSHTIAATSPQGTGGTRYSFASWSDGGAQSHTIATPSAAATYTASFQTSYLLTTAVSPASSGSVQASPASPDGYYANGTNVQLTASPNSGYQFSAWSGGAAGSANPVSVAMTAPRSVTAAFTAAPAGVTITTSPAGLGIVVDGASYTAPQTFQWTPGSSHTIAATSPQGAGGTRYSFASWSDGGAQSHTIATPSAAATYTASFQTSYLLTTAVSPASSGSVQASPASPDGYYASGTTVQLTGLPATGYQFANWTGAVSGTTNPAPLAVNGPASVTANFVNTPQGITITTNPPGLTILVDGGSYAAPQTFQWTPGTTHTIGAVSPQGSGGVRQTFNNWSDGGAQTHTITAPSSSTTYTASFQTAYQLTTAVTPPGAGTVQVAPSSPDGYYAAGTQVQITAIPGSGYQWSSWTGAGAASTNPATVPITSAQTVTANFTSSPQGITITTNPPGLEILVDGAVHTSPRTFQWTPGSSHTIAAASPQGAGGTRHTFAGWSDGGAQSHSITTPTASATYTASFQTAYLLTTAVSPAGAGTVQVSPPSPDGYYTHGTAVQLTAAPASGYQFASWTGGATGAASPATVTITGPATVTGTFTGVSTGVTVTTNPPGLGLVVDGVTITAPQTFQWAPGSTHTIGALAPPPAGGTRRLFSGWSDGGAQTHTITVSPAPVTYTASYLVQHQLTTSANPPGAGSVQVTPASPDGYYSSGAVVQLTAAANGGYQFANWTGDLAGQASPGALTMSGPRTVYAVFAAGSTCTYTLSRATFAAPPEGELGRVDIGAGANCIWTASTNTSWLGITSGFSGSGNGTVRFSVAPNSSPTLRTGTILIGGQTLAVSQASAGCGAAFNVQSPPSLLFSQAGAAFNLSVAAAPECAWPVSPAPSWLTMVSSAAGSGNGNPELAAAGNPAPLPRTGSVSLAGMVSQLVQAPAGDSQPFADVPIGHPYLHHVNLLRTYGVTSGCTSGQYCPDAPTTRGQMAVFIVRSILGGDDFPFPDTPFFTDVAASHPYYRHIQKMRELGITTGCNANQYCPDAPVTRGQMAVFLVRARLAIAAGQSFPHPSQVFFQDVSPAHPYFSFIQKMRQLGITTGCSTTEYCADGPTTRGQMAVFLIRAFFTP